jgi:hypothetical protein
MSTVCSESVGESPRSGEMLDWDEGGNGVDDAFIARSRTTSRRIEGRRGWLFAKGEGGAVT